MDAALEGEPTYADHVCVLLRVIEIIAETEILEVTVFVNDGELALETDAEYVALLDKEWLLVTDGESDEDDDVDGDTEALGEGDGDELDDGLEYTDSDTDTE